MLNLLKGMGKAYLRNRASKKAFKTAKGTTKLQHPVITSVKPTKNIKGSVERGKSKEYSRRIDKLAAAQKKVSEGKKMMQEGQKERKRMQDTGTAFKFRHSKSYHPINPEGDVQRYKIKKGVAQ